jgi:hypothetical protein
MIAWRWFEAYPPRGMSLDDSTAFMRALVGRPRFGVLDLMPMVDFELWIRRDQLCWLIGMDERIADRFPSELHAQCPAVVLVPVAVPSRPTVIAGREVRFRSLAYPVRTDVAERVTAALVSIREHLDEGEAVALQFVIGPSHRFTTYPQRQTPLTTLGFGTAPEPDSDDQRAWRTKVSEPLFGIRGRMGASAMSPRRAAELTRPVYAALALTNDRHGRVQVSPQSSRIAAQLMHVMGRVRTWSSVTNAAELAVLTGWNVADLDVPGTSNGFALPPQKLLATDITNPTERIAGTSTHPATRGQAVRMPLPTYHAHLHVIGPTNSGKSTTLARWVLAEATAGRSVVVIEPKGDLVEDILARLPKERHEDVVILDPGTDGTLPVVGFNPLQGRREDAERRADSLLGLFKELFGASVGPRSSDVLLHALIAVSRLEDGALTDVMPFLTNDRFRRWILKRVSDPLTLDPWAAWFDSVSAAERGQIVAPVGNKLRILSARPSVRRLLGQPNPTFRLDAVFERPTVLLVNLNAGAVGPETSKIVGTLLLNQLWDAVQRQTTKPAKQRRAVPVIVDEFQLFTAGLDFADVLARARGANVPFTIAHQHLDQLSPTLKSAVLANARSRLAYRPAEGDSRALAAVLGNAITPADLERLPAYHAVARLLDEGTPSATFEVATPPLPEPSNDPRALRRSAAERLGVGPAELDASILNRWAGNSARPEGPIGVRRKRS